MYSVSSNTWLTGTLEAVSPITIHAHSQCTSVGNMIPVLLVINWSSHSPAHPFDLLQISFTGIWGSLQPLSHLSSHTEATTATCNSLTTPCSSCPCVSGMPSYLLGMTFLATWSSLTQIRGAFSPVKFLSLGYHGLVTSELEHMLQLSFFSFLFVCLLRTKHTLGT